MSRTKDHKQSFLLSNEDLQSPILLIKWIQLAVDGVHLALSWILWSCHLPTLPTLFVMLYSILGVCLYKSRVLLLCLLCIFQYRKIFCWGLPWDKIAESSPWWWYFFRWFVLQCQKNFNLWCCPHFQARNNTIAMLLPLQFKIEIICFLHIVYVYRNKRNEIRKLMLLEFFLIPYWHPPKFSLTLHIMYNVESKMFWFLKTILKAYEKNYNSMCIKIWISSYFIVFNFLTSNCSYCRFKYNADIFKHKYYS